MSSKTNKTSYHEISISDVYIDRVGWSAGDELSVQPTQLEDGNALIIRNVSKIDMSNMQFMTLKS